MKIKIPLLIILLFRIFPAAADEGMWLPMLLKQLNEQEMQIKGLKITAEEIYSVNKNSIKDAVILFDGKCTGEIISDQGLILTNHHCGHSQIQAHSSLEHNYLRDGFWAMNRKEELPCPGLTATFIVRMDDVTNEIMKVLNDSMTEEQRNEKIKQAAFQLEKKAVEGTHYEAKVKSFFNGNDFYLIVTETFKDVRMVGAPPLSIGSFGGDTDNWMWPRHTGDFSLFRIYANKNNEAADYSADNVPFHPKYFFPICVGGVKEDDFTFVYGFPGRTQEYLTSYAVDIIANVSDPNRVKVRDQRLAIIEEAMRNDEKIHIQYSSKKSGVANAWKKWQGEASGLIRSNTVQKKQEEEKDFAVWVSKDASRQAKYGNLLNDFKQVYDGFTPYITANDFYAEAGMGIEIINYATGFSQLIDLSKAKTRDEKAIKVEAEKLLKAAELYFKDYDAPTDKKVMAALLKLYNDNVVDSLRPSALMEIKSKYNNDYAAYADEIFKHSVFTSMETIKKILSDPTKKNLKKLAKDPAWKLAENINSTYQTKIAPTVTVRNNRLTKLNRLYMQAQLEMADGKKMYPDANLTLRIAYGNVKPYHPRDGVDYNFYTTLEGVIEKYKPKDEEFDVPAKLIQLYKQKDYGRYGVNGKMPLAFIATNHTTGGNSGSPVLNAKGHLLGTNFDRVWEGTMSDIDFNPEICRNITLDIRYTLFIIDKFAGAKYLVDEMQLVND